MLAAIGTQTGAPDDTLKVPTAIGGAITGDTRTRFGTDITITPAQALLAVPGPDGRTPPGFASGVKLSAALRLPDGSPSDAVSWTSLDPETAAVDSTGQVSVMAGARSGTVRIVASSLVDPGLEGSVELLVRRLTTVTVRIDSPFPTSAVSFLVAGSSQESGIFPPVAIPRPANGGAATASIVVPEGDMVTILAEAYDDPQLYDKTLGAPATMVASASQDFSPPVDGAPLALTLSPRFVPSVGLPAVGALNGAIGGIMRLGGKDLGLARNTEFSVRLAGTDLLASRVSGEIFLFTVPASATSGDLVVTSDGISGAPVPFKVVASVALTGVPSVMSAGATAALAVAATDPAGAAIGNPTVVWSVRSVPDTSASPDPAATPPPLPQIASFLDPGLLLAGPATGTALVRVTSGPLEASVSILVR